MKERIIEQLEKFALCNQNAPDEMLQIIYEEIRRETDAKCTLEELIQRSEQIHKHILHHYAALSISTIDAFTHRIVQSFKKELHFPYHFEITMAKELLLEEATDKLLESISDDSNQALGKFLVTFASSKISDEKPWYIDKDIQNYGKDLFNEEKYLLIRKLRHLSPEDFERLNKKIRKKITNFQESLQPIAQRALDAVAHRGLDKKSIYYGDNGIYGYFERYALLKSDLSKPPNSYVRKTIEEDKWYGGKASELEKAAIDSLASELKTYFHQIEAIRKKQGSTYIICKMLAKEIFGLGILNELDAQMQLIKEEKTLVHISDFNRKINRIIENEPVPYIYERIGEKYKHLLIDEFQDTSQMQWHNLIPLVSNSLNNGHLSMIVGDAKQAIYRWRGSKSEMIVNLPKVLTALPESPLTEQASIFQYAAKNNIRTLKKNFRSYHHIIDFNNRFFTHIINSKKEYSALAAYYNELEQKEAKKRGGQVQINTLQDHENKATRLQIHIRRIIQIITMLTEEKGYAYREIAILCRKNDEGSAIAENLLNENISVASSESLSLNTSPVIGFIIEILRIINQIIDEQSIAKIFYFIDVYLQKNIPDSQHTERLIAFVAELKTEEKKQAKDIIGLFNHTFGYAFDIQKSDILSLVELVEEIVSCFHLGKSEAQQIYLQKFLDFTLQFTTEKGSNIGEFLEEWMHQKEKISVSAPESSNSVRIMTIHKSKGLQFPIVILASADWDISGNRVKLWKASKGTEFAKLTEFKELKTLILSHNQILKDTVFEDDFLKEEQAQVIDVINMLYVGLTRPEERLFILTDNKSSSKKGSIAWLLNSFVEKEEEEKNIDKQKEEIFIEKKTYTYQVSDLYSCKFEKISCEQTNTVTTEKHIKNFLHQPSRHKIIFRRNSGLSSSGMNLQTLLNPRVRGILIHKAFEYIYDVDDISFSIQTLIQQGLIAGHEREIFEQNIREVISLPELNEFFSKGSGIKIYNERDLLIPKGKEMGTLRPDRVMVHRDELIILDYKTGKEKIAQHFKQLDRYADFFGGLRFKKIKKMIVYTEIPAVLSNSD